MVIPPTNSIVPLFLLQEGLSTTVLVLGNHEWRSTLLVGNDAGVTILATRKTAASVNNIISIRLNITDVFTGTHDNDQTTISDVMPFTWWDLTTVAPGVTSRASQSFQQHGVMIPPPCEISGFVLPPGVWWIYNNLFDCNRWNTSKATSPERLESRFQPTSSHDLRSDVCDCCSCRSRSA